MDERAWAAVALPDGGFAVLGETGASKTPGNGIDFWLLRLDASGKLLWDSTYGGSEGERGYGIASLADGGFVLTGYTGTYGDGLWSTWVVRTDAAGQMHWQQAYGSPEMDHGQAIVGLTGGGFAIAGQIHDAKAAIDQGLLVRADHWGSAACTTAGPCLKLTLSDCDDNKPCTSDNCRSTPPLGCWHADMPAGAWCGDGMSCKAATCSIAP